MVTSLMSPPPPRRTAGAFGCCWGGRRRRTGIEGVATNWGVWVATRSIPHDPFHIRNGSRGMDIVWNGSFHTIHSTRKTRAPISRPGGERRSTSVTRSTHAAAAVSTGWWLAPPMLLWCVVCAPADPGGARCWAVLAAAREGGGTAPVDVASLNLPTPSSQAGIKVVDVVCEEKSEDNPPQLDSRAHLLPRRAALHARNRTNAADACGLLGLGH
jgi:hypothetical protein